LHYYFYPPNSMDFSEMDIETFKVGKKNVQIHYVIILTQGEAGIYVKIV